MAKIILFLIILVLLIAGGLSVFLFLGNTKLLNNAGISENNNGKNANEDNGLSGRVESNSLGARAGDGRGERGGSGGGE